MALSYSHRHIVPRGHAVTGEYYCNVVRGLLKAKLKKKLPPYPDFGCTLHHDNAHRLAICQRIIEELRVEIVVCILYIYVFRTM